MRCLADSAKALNRSTVYLSGLQKRFELPMFEGAAYPPAYVAFLRAVIALRTFDISEETLRDLWHLEKKLLQLLHVDTTGSRTWFLDACGQTSHPECRLLLTNHDLGIALDAQELQPGLNFAVGLALIPSPCPRSVRIVRRRILKIEARIEFSDNEIGASLHALRAGPPHKLFITP